MKTRLTLKQPNRGRNSISLSLGLATGLVGLIEMLSILVPKLDSATLFSNEKERCVASTLTQRHGTNSISYFALSQEKAYFFSASSKSVISYVLQGRVAVVAGDPIGPE